MGQTVSEIEWEARAASASISPPYPFLCQQTPLPLQTLRESAQPTVSGQYSMAWNKHRNRIRTTGPSHSSCRRAATDSSGQCAISQRLATWNCLKRSPNPALKFRASGEIQRWQTRGRDAIEHGLQRSFRSANPACGNLMFGRCSSSSPPPFLFRELQTCKTVIAKTSQECTEFCLQHHLLQRS